MRRALVLLLVLTACAWPSSDRPAGGSASPRPGEGSAQLLFAGDVMLGRGVARAGAADPSSLLAGVRSVVAAADLAVANLESPLTDLPHDPELGPNVLEAPPSSGELLASAGFDAMGIANNHAGDAGPSTVADTMAALRTAGVTPVGGGDVEDAFAPVIVSAAGLRVALLAFDATGQGPRAGPSSSGVAWWDETLVHEAVVRARADADVVAVGIHGGIDPGQWRCSSFPFSSSRPCGSSPAPGARRCLRRGARALRRWPSTGQWIPRWAGPAPCRQSRRQGRSRTCPLPGSGPRIPDGFPGPWSPPAGRCRRCPGS